MIHYANNPAFTLTHTSGIYNLYTPVNVTDYHKSREVEATIQNIYSNAGATAEFLASICDEGLAMLERDDKNLKQNVAAILSNIKFRTKYPVDGLCAVRMGAILSYLEYTTETGVISEPEVASYAWINKKVQLASDDPKLYDFFFRWGVRNTHAYLEHLDTLSDQDYLSRRNEQIRSLYPLPNESGK